MSDIVLPEDSQEEQLKYQPTEKDEEEFFLMYHYNWAPSEVQKLEDDYRKWIIARTFAQKQAEKEMMQRMRLMNEIGPNLKVT